MADASDDLEKWLTRMLLLLPGFFSVGLARYVGNIAAPDEFELTLYSLALSLVIFFLAVVVSRLGILFGVVKRTARTASALPGPTLSFIALTLSISVILGVMIANAYETDSFLKSLRKVPGLRMTTKRSFDRPMNLLLRLNHQGNLEEGRPAGLKKGEAWVEIVLDNGTTFQGYPKFFGMGAEVSEIFLSPACTADDGEIDIIYGPGVVVPQERIQYLILEDRESSHCHNIWKAIVEEAAGEEQSSAVTGAAAPNPLPTAIP